MKACAAIQEVHGDPRRDGHGGEVFPYLVCREPLGHKGGHKAPGFSLLSRAEIDHLQSLWPNKGWETDTGKA